MIKLFTVLNKAIEHDETDLEALLNLSISYINNNSIFSCLDTLKKWILSNTKYEKIVKEYGKENIDNPSQILTEVFTQAHESDKSDTKVLCALGVLCFTENNFSKAAENFKACVNIEPKNYGNWNKLGASYANSLQPEKARTCYNVAIKMRPNLVRAWSNLAIAYNENSSYNQAIVPCLNAIVLNSNNNDWNNLRVFLSLLQKTDECDKALNKDLDYFTEHYSVIDPDNLPLPNYDNLDEALSSINAEES